MVPMESIFSLANQSERYVQAAEMDQADLQINGTDLDQHVEAMLKDRSLPYHLKAVLAILLED